ncbi:nicotinate-nucleotide--dimethylbenzimidazole phosphoribosyltransferase [Thalassotalea insulae]|uniref:Nicotinate-nucleotide--dimethylbenzimidazole phosphoribosyltransferase n=1 Tax=Thalassotalea insulae TaxID=2056778 RepID=A0ABQ6GTG6_9GAMM|nr:nicotinate-nucleotide--dimethylbenzimidazole phosphoribosyltransferase [Thalassotalea insulae]GLX79241.1 nicotinate-nucleotide--dimethylbenzimidazole phosphoribosyltransferase [Thalassotalea insulae]
MFTIDSLVSPKSSAFLHAIQDKIINKTKPPGSLGLLEQVAQQLALIQSVASGEFCQRIEINQPTAIVFAGDHGIAQQNVSIAPSDVTRQMVLNFLQGGAAINCFCRDNNIALKVVDAGIQTPLTVKEKSLSADFIEQRLGAGTEDISQRAAMTMAQVEQGIAYGQQIVSSIRTTGCNLLIFGEMGIANTSAASAIYIALTGENVQDSVGQGTGISSEQLTRKKALVAQAVERAQQAVETFEPMDVLAELGGFEIVQIVGAMLAAAQAKMVILVDGFIVTSAALVAAKLYPEVSDYFIFAHQSNELAHKKMLAYFNVTPLLSLDLRLGEGTGAALALPLVQAAASFYNEMASFESAGVTV